MTGLELDRLECGEKPATAAMWENAPQWAPTMLTGAANYVSTLAIYARYPTRLDGPLLEHPVAHHQRRYSLAGWTRPGWLRP